MTIFKHHDVIILGAGAAGLMCAIEAGKRGRSVAVLDKAKKPAGKIRISGGGKCNFTNLYMTPENYLSQNPHFCKSALARYTQWDFIALFSDYGLTMEEREHGQLFCEEGAQAIIDLLLDECAKVGVEIRTRTEVESVQHDQLYRLQTTQGEMACESLVVATGGPSIPRMGSTDFGLSLAKQFGLKSIPFKPILVPFTFAPDFLKTYLHGLSGISFTATVSCNNMSFTEQLLVTHRGLSGPVILQISSYWHKGDAIEIDLLPSLDVSDWLQEQQNQRPKAELKTVLSEQLPKRLVQRLCDNDLGNKPMNQYQAQDLQRIGAFINAWVVTPSGTEGMRTAEAASGGVNTDELSSKTLESKRHPGLYFIGEVVDVTGQLGGFNFQWAWASGWCAGQYV